MDEKELRTSPKQRFFIILIAVLMVGSIVASYAAIVASGTASNQATTDTAEIDTAKIAEYEAAYHELEEKFTAAAASDFAEFIEFKGEIKAYNEASANGEGVTVRDLKVGDGAELTAESTDYLAYYVGWCADESIFDSAFDNNDNPQAFIKILDASLGMIEGWNLGIEGMKINGIREMTIPGELAYGDSMEICGGTNKPLKFIVMTKAKSGAIADLAAQLDEAYLRYQYAQYGIDYDSIQSNTE